MTPNQRLKQARIKAGYTSAMGFAKHHGIKPSTYASHENGSAAIRPYWAELYSQKLRTTAEWILSGAEVSTSKKKKLASLARSGDPRDHAVIGGDGPNTVSLTDLGNGEIKLFVNTPVKAETARRVMAILMGKE